MKPIRILWVNNFILGCWVFFFFVSIFFRLFIWFVLFSFCSRELWISFFSYSISCEHVILLRSHNYIPCSHYDKRCAAQSDTRSDSVMFFYLSIGLMLFLICFELNVLIYWLAFHFIIQFNAIQLHITHPYYMYRPIKWFQNILKGRNEVWKIAKGK